jgi:hypothetical protein
MTDNAQLGVAPRRKFNVFLAIGIFFLPIVFVWFLLRRGHSTTARIIGFVWTALFVVVALTSPPSNTTDTTQAAPSAPQVAESATEIAARHRREVERSPERFLVLEDESGVRAGFDTVFLLSGRIQNTTDVDIKDPTIICALFGDSGTEIGRVRETLLQIVPANGRKSFSELNMGFMGSTQVASYNCEIIDAQAMLE